MRIAPGTLVDLTNPAAHPRRNLGRLEPCGNIVQTIGDRFQSGGRLVLAGAGRSRTAAPIATVARLVQLVGDHQAAETVGHYRLTETFLDIAEEFGTDRIVAMGGVPTGELIEEYAVIGAATGAELADELRSAGVEFHTDEPEGGIVGTSGLLLGLGARRGFPAACLMGRTSGYLVDPKSARAVLEILGLHLGIDVDFERLEERADEMEDAVAEMQEQQVGGVTDGEENLRYFG